MPASFICKPAVPLPAVAPPGAPWYSPAMRKINRPLHRLITTLIGIALLVTACDTPDTQAESLGVTLAVDGTQETLWVDPASTVSDVLRDADISLSDRDRVNPQSFTRVVHGMTITVVRVTEETITEQEIIPFERQTTLNDGLAPGDTRLLQAGINGIAEVTIRVVYEDGEEISRSEVRRLLLTSPQDEIVMVGTQSDLPTVTVSGTLAYISNGNAWVMSQNSANRRPLTLNGAVDGRVFELSPDGRSLLFTRTLNGEEFEETPVDIPESDEDQAAPQAQPTASDDGEPFNSLWVVIDVDDPGNEAIRLDLDNILSAAWFPGGGLNIVYTTAEPRPGFPGWQANNDLWRAKLTVGGGTTDRKQLLEASSGGIYGWFGTFFKFGPDGETLAWAQPDRLGVMLPVYEQDEDATPTPLADEDSVPLPDAYIQQILLEFTPRTPYDFVWVPEFGWSPDGALIAAVTHGEALGSEAAEDSEVFNLTAFPSAGGYSIDLIEQAGMWAAPRFSPQDESGGYQLAYLEAIEPLASQGSRYVLMIMDRDGSNARQLYPAEDAQGFLASDQSFAWSPDGRQIVMTWQRNLYLLDVETGLTQQLTTDGATSSPRWSQ